MVWAFLTLVFTCVVSLAAWGLSESSDYTFTERWDIKRLKRNTLTIKDKFPMHATVPCGDLHQTAEAPFTAIILHKESGRLLCMGSIIDTMHILTAKICYDKTDYNDVMALVGYYKAYWGRYSQVKRVKQILRHEYEIVILRLANPIRFTEYIQPVRLPSSMTKRIDAFDKAFPPPYKVIGFSVDRFALPGDFIHKEKLYMIKEDDFLKYEDCRENYTRNSYEANKLFCTFGNATFCWGGWGAPVLKMLHHTYSVQVGIVIADSCTPNSTGPFLVTRTDVFIDWIRGNSYHGHQSS